MQSKPMTEIISIRFYNDRGSELHRATTQMKLFVVERIVKNNRNNLEFISWQN